MENEFMKRGYLLPEGCKDLSDVAKLKPRQMPDVLLASLPEKFTFYDQTDKAPKPSAPLPPITRQVFIPPGTSVKKLAALLEQKPIEIIGDLMKLGVFAMVDYLLDFETISKVARMHGYQAIKGA
jgi:hypothetical protein